MILPLILITALLAPAQPDLQPAPSAPAPAVAPDTLQSKLDALDKKIAAIKDLSADFEQQKKTALLKKPLTSSGAIKLKGQHTRWDTARPHPTVMTIDAAEVRIYYPDQKSQEIYPIRGEMARLASSPLPRISIIREQFEIAELKPTDIDPKADPHASLLALSLAPKSDSLKQHVQQIRVLIDAGSACAKLVEITDADGDKTTIAFTNIKIDAGLSDQDVQFTPPPGTQVSRPLDAAPPQGGSK